MQSCGSNSGSQPWQQALLSAGQSCWSTNGIFFLKFAKSFQIFGKKREKNYSWGGGRGQRTGVSVRKKSQEPVSWLGGRRDLLPSLMTRVPSPGPTWWRESAPTDCLLTHTDTVAQTHTRIERDAIRFLRGEETKNSIFSILYL